MPTLYAHSLLLSLPFLFAIIGIGLLLVWIAEKSPARRLLQSCAGVAAPVASVIALLFGLFSAFLANDVSIHTDRARAAVMREANATATVLSVAAALGERGTVLKQAALDFARLTTHDDWASPAQTAAADAQGVRMLNDVLFGGPATADAQVKQTVLAAIADMRGARSDMVAIARSDTSWLKWIAAFILGILTQTGVVAVHLGKPRSAILAVTLFATGMAFMLWVLLMRLDPFIGRNSVTLTPIATVAQPYAAR